MLPPLHYSSEESLAPVQFVSPGQGYYNPPTSNPMHRISSPHTPMRRTCSYSEADKPQIRPLSVDEALQFSPLASIVPFDSGMIPAPNGDVEVAKSAFQSPEHERAGKQQLRALNQELARTGEQSPVIGSVLKGLVAMLGSEEGPEFEFKAPRPPPTGYADQKLGPEAPSHIVLVSHLSPLARMVLERSKVPWRHLSLESPRITPKKRAVHKQISQPPMPQPLPCQSSPRQSPPFKSPSNNTTSQAHSVSPKTSHLQDKSLPSMHLQQNQVAHNQNNRLVPTVYVPPVPPHHKLAAQVPSPSSKKTVAESTSKSGLQVVIASTPLSGPRDAYKVYAGRPPVTVGSPLSSSTRPVPQGDYSDQKAAADATLKDLQDALHDVFEAEADAQTSGLSSATDGFFVSATGLDGDVVIFSPSILVKLDSLLRKVIERRRFGLINPEHILHLQKLCERSFACADNMQINLQSDWPNMEESARNDEVKTCEQALQSARLILRTMAGGHQDKKVMSEELLQNSISLLNKVVNSFIVPAVEARSTGSDTAVFQLAVSCKKVLGQVLFQCNKLMQLLLSILAKEEIPESAVNQVEYLVIRMLFVENAPSEKESVLGIAKFESLRRFAMLVLVEVFARYPEQRRSIVNEVLSSLEKLPTARQHGRQFRLEDGKRLQLVTVLLVRLVQSSGMNATTKSAMTHLKTQRDAGDDTVSEAEESENDTHPQTHDNDDNNGDEDHEDDNAVDTIPSKLINNVRKLYDAAVISGWQIIKFLVHRASTASKTGEQPHRHLLDMFVEDLVSILGLPEWPGAELLLQLLVNKMTEMATADKTPAPTKSMALETLGTLGSAILDVRFDAHHAAKAIETDTSEQSHKLVDIFEDHLQGQNTDFDVANWKGPYRIAMRYLQNSESEGKSSSSSGYLLTKWAKVLIWGGNRTTFAEPSDGRLSGGARDLTVLLCRMIADGKFKDEDVLELTPAQARLAYLIAILHTGFCQSFTHIVSLLLGSITSDHITVRTRSLKSVTQMLEKDPALLDRHPQVIKLILACTTDTSASVRDNSLALLGKCINLRPSVEREVLQTVVTASLDPTVGIRKRALKLLRDAYLREEKTSDSEGYRQWRLNVKTLSAHSIFRRTNDEEESIVELAQQIFEETWLDPFRSSISTDKLSITDKIHFKEHVALLIQVVREYEDMPKSIEDLLSRALSAKGKHPESSRTICKALVSCAFEGIIDAGELPNSPAQHQVLQVLAIFARTEPRLFTVEHIELLKPYVSCLSSGDDLNLFRGVVIILRCVLPALPALQHESLRKVQNNLQLAVSKLPKAELDEVAACLWTISKVLDNTEKLARLVISVLTNLQKIQARQDLSEEFLSKAYRLMRIAGYFGKHCDFQPQLNVFNEALPALKGELVAGKIVSGLLPFTNAQRSLACKVEAWSGIGMICQSWPRTFNHAGIAKDIQQILQMGETNLQRIILNSIRDFFATQDQAHDTHANALEKDPLANGKLGTSMTATDNDGAAALIAQAYLKHILQIALNRTDDIALIATEVIASISRQGLVHPKEVGPALVALATCPNQRIVQVALQQLQNLHSHHETLFEREYMRAVNEAFVYQRDMFQSTAGFVNPPLRAKLHHVYEVIKTSKAKFINKFLTNMCSRVDFELPKLDVSAEIPAHLQYARFLLENLAFFDFGRLDDVSLVISCLEKAVSATGSIVAHAINTELFNVTVESVLSQPSTGVHDVDAGVLYDSNQLGVPETTAESAVQDIPPRRLRQLATASIILTLLWETRTFLRRLYNIGINNQRQGKGRPLKDQNRAPTKNSNTSGDKFLESIANTSNCLISEKDSVNCCRLFAQHMAIDDELKVAAGDDDDINADIDGLAVEDDIDMDGSSRGFKRKSSVSASGAPKKKRGRPSKSGAGRKASEDLDIWE